MKRFAAICLLVLCTGASCGDIFQLKSGGRLEGEIVDVDQSRPRTFVVQLATGGKVTLDARKVKVVAESAERKKYEQSLKQMRDRVEDHLSVSRLCKELNLGQEADFHLEQVLRLDPEHERARQLLGFQKTPDGGWATREELLRASGYVRHEGGWSLPQHLEIERAQEALEEKQVAWRKKLRMWRVWLGSGKPERREEALENIQSIRDPAAALALAKMFANEGHDETRWLLAEVLGTMNHGEAASALLRSALQDADREMRLHCIEQLAKGPNRSLAVRAFVGKLGSKSNLSINRAAVALGKLDDQAAVRPLIEALVTGHKYKYQIGGGSGNMNVTFNRDGAGNGGLGGLGMGNRIKTGIRNRENKSVLNALISLTGMNFKYSTAEWKRWYVSRTSPLGLDLRRDG